MNNTRQPATAGESMVARPRRWLQFRLKWLLLFMAVLSVPLSWLGWKLEEKRKERWAEAELSKFSVVLSRDASEPDDPFAENVAPGPTWLRRVLGDDFFIHVEGIECWPSAVDTHVDLDALSGPQREELSDDPPLTDAEMAYLRHLPRLREMHLDGAEVTDLGLSRLYSLSRLELLDLSGTKVSANAVAELRKALPKCRIVYESRQHEELMDIDRFWAIIARACKSNLHNAEHWDHQLEAELSKLTADEIVEWNLIFDRLAALAYTEDLWGAAYTINGGASDDGFYYFRCWLVGMGKDVYEAAIANPDSLADVVSPKVDAEAEIYAAAHQAWMALTGKSYDDPYPARNEDAELQGGSWNFEDDDEVRRRLPRLAAMYLK